MLGVRGQLGARRDDAECNLSFESRAAPCIPSGVELADVGIAPLWGYVVRSVPGTHCEPHQEGPVRLVTPQSPDTGERLVGQILAQVIALLGSSGRVNV